MRTSIALVSVVLKVRWTAHTQRWPSAICLHVVLTICYFGIVAK